HENTLPGNLQVSPNPASDVLHVTWDAGYSVVQIDIYDVSGKRVMSSAVNGQNADLNISELPDGVYNMKITGGNGQVTDYRFMKN
ncbi:MAG TPA: T9SS type A sorting domain-containing protein, partial [Bacteroidia bacterium]|nr:T9SS type A sorting domain-containing protein [Bacteroidia bacterium]